MQKGLSSECCGIQGSAHLPEGPPCDEDIDGGAWRALGSSAGSRDPSAAGIRAPSSSSLIPLSMNSSSPPAVLLLGSRRALCPEVVQLED